MFKTPWGLLLQAEELSMVPHQLKICWDMSNPDLSIPQNRILGRKLLWFCNVLGLMLLHLGCQLKIFLPLVCLCAFVS